MSRNIYNNRIRIVLADKVITNRALATYLGVNEMTVSRWTTNKIQPSMSQFVDIAKFLNVQLEELIESKPDKE